MLRSHLSLTAVFPSRRVDRGLIRSKEEFPTIVILLYAPIAMAAMLNRIKDDEADTAQFSQVSPTNPRSIAAADCEISLTFPAILCHYEAYMKRRITCFSFEKVALVNYVTPR